MSEQAKRVAIYARVSTNKDQRPEVQLDELKKYCAARGWDVVAEIVDQGFSGKTSHRPGLKKLLALSRSRKVDVVVVVKLDRLFRSLKHLVTTLQEFKDLRIDFVSLRDQIDLTTASGVLLFHLLAAFGEFELSLVRERTIAGLEHARSKGIRLGRPQKHDPEAILKLRQQGLSYRQIQKQLNVPQGVIWDAIQCARKTSPDSEPESAVVTGGD